MPRHAPKRRARVTKADNLARLEWNIRDAKEALKNAVDLGNWEAVRKYTAQIEALEKLHFKASNPSPGATNRNRFRHGVRIYSYESAGDKFGRGRLP